MTKWKLVRSAIAVVVFDFVGADIAQCIYAHANDLAIRSAIPKAGSVIASLMPKREETVYLNCVFLRHPGVRLLVDFEFEWSGSAVGTTIGRRLDAVVRYLTCIRCNGCHYYADTYIMTHFRINAIK
jgi:hypothetical protein